LLIFNFKTGFTWVTCH